MSVKINEKTVGRMGMGVMNLTWGQTVPYPEAFNAIKTAVDGGISVINTASFYGPPENPNASLHLLRAFFDENPEYADKVVLTVKGAVIMAQHKISGTYDFLKADLERIKGDLGGVKSVDVYVISRQPDDVYVFETVEELIQNLERLRSEGYFSSIGLSEVKAETIRRAASVAPIAVVENELSLFHLDGPALDALRACDELGIAFTAYSPLGRGMLTKRYKSSDEMPPDDIRRRFPRFQGDNFGKNLELSDKVAEIAKRKGVTVAQLGLAYVMRLSPVVIPLQGSSSPDRILENIKAVDVTLDEGDVKEIDEILAEFEVAGDRYGAYAQSGLMK